MKKEIVQTILSVVILISTGLFSLGLLAKKEEELSRSKTGIVIKEHIVQLEQLEGTLLAPINAKTLDNKPYKLDDNMSQGGHMLILLSAAACNKVQISEMREISKRFRLSNNANEITILYHNTGDNYHDRRDLALLKKVTNVPFTVAYTSSLYYHSKFGKGMFPIYIEVHDGEIVKSWSTYTDQKRIYDWATNQNQDVLLP